MEKREILQIILGLKTDKQRKSTLQMALSKARRLISFDKNKDYSYPLWSFRNTEGLDLEEIPNIVVGNA